MRVTEKLETLVKNYSWPKEIIEVQVVKNKSWNLVLTYKRKEKIMLFYFLAIPPKRKKSHAVLNCLPNSYNDDIVNMLKNEIFSCLYQKRGTPQTG